MRAGRAHSGQCPKTPSVPTKTVKSPSGSAARPRVWPPPVHLATTPNRVPVTWPRHPAAFRSTMPSLETPCRPFGPCIPQGGHQKIPMAHIGGTPGLRLLWPMRAPADGPYGPGPNSSALDRPQAQLVRAQSCLFWRVVGLTGPLGGGGLSGTLWAGSVAPLARSSGSVAPLASSGGALACSSGSVARSWRADGAVAAGGHQARVVRHIKPLGPYDICKRHPLRAVQRGGEGGPFNVRCC
jgi:hypothetical protein